MNVNDPAPLDSALATQDKLRDMRAHLDTMTPQLVHSAAGRIMMAAASMPEGMALEEDYPLTTPKLKLPPIGEDPDFIDQYNASLVRDIESQFDGYGINTMEGTDGSHLLGRCCTVALKGVGFQVIWSGARRQWIVLSGKVRYSDPSNPDQYLEIIIPKTYLDGISGWITLPFTFVPGIAPLSGFPDFQVGSVASPRISSSGPISNPPTRSGVQADPGGSSFLGAYTWSQGVFYLPLARVFTPSTLARRTPRIEVCHVGNIWLSSQWRGSFPYYNRFI